MTQTPSPQDHTTKAVPSSSSDKATPNRKQVWSLKAKAMALALTVSMLPVLMVGTATYLGGQLNYQQMSQLRQEERLRETEALQRQLLSFLLMSTGVTAVLAGAIAAIVVNRSIRRVLNAAATSTTVVNRLRRQEINTRSRVALKDELVALEANLKLIEEQLPELVWKQEAAVEISQLLINISRRIWGSRSQEDVLRTAVEEVRQALKTDRVTIFRFDKNWDGTFVEESVAPGWPKALWSTIHDPCFAGGYVEKYRKGRVRALDNIYEAGLSDCYIGLLERFAVKANLIAPIILDNQLYGLLIAHECSAPRSWQHVEIDLFAQLAAQVGFALDHASLLEQVDTKADQLQVFIDITRRIRESLNEEDILKSTVEEARKALRSDRVIVFGFDENWYGTVLAESVLPGFPKALRAKIHDPCFAEGYVDQYQAGRVQATNNIYEAGLTPCHLSQLEPFAVQANLVAPILKDDKLFGLLIAHQCSKTREWQKPEIDLFTQVAMQVGYALDHARLLNQLDQAYQAAETTSDEQLLQKEALQRQVSELLRERKTAIKTLVTEESNQMESVQAAYNHVKAVADLAQGMDIMIQQVKLHKQQVSREVQAGDEAIIRVLDSFIAIRQTIVEATEKLSHLDQTSQNLSSALVLISNVISELNLLAMNITLKATQSGKAEQEGIAIAERVTISTRQLKGSIAETESLVAKMQAQTQEVMVAIAVGTKQATAGTQLVDATRQKLNSVVTVNTQMDSLVEEIAQAAANQTQTSTTANRVILEVASIVNHTSKQFMAVVKSFNKLAEIAEEFPADED
ncbi:methyl-accepting chemotaxis protein [Mastigocladopsis repens]|uniref:methyl-accepting chemotaxis protein n=1 Tax=Mastigocladopsis repens TaxID=221287 RepID=UPI0002D80B3F|nr:GAF domain-containing protein [Mastigocladopsis repens]